MLNFSRTKNRIIVTVMTFFVAFFAMGFTAYANLDRIISPKNYYLMVESRNIISAMQNIPKLFTQNEYISQAVQVQKKLDVSFISNLKNIESMAYFDEILNKLNLVMKINTNKEEETGVFETTLNYNNIQFLKGTAFKDKNIIGINVPTIYEKYLIADQTNLPAVFKNLGMDIGYTPQKQITQKDIIEALDLNNELLNDLFFDFLSVYEDSISSENVTLQRNISITDKSGQKIDCTAINVTFDQAAIKNLLIGWLDILQNNTELNQQIVTSNNNLHNLFNDTGYKDIDIYELTEQEVEAGINEFVSNAKAEINKSDELEKIALSIYVDSKDKIIQRTFDLDTKADDNVSEEGFIATYKALGNAKNNFENSLEFRTKGDLSEGFLISNIYKYDSVLNKRVGSLVMSISQNNWDDENEETTFGVDYKVNPDEKSDSGLYTGEYKFVYNNSNHTVPFEDNMDISFNITQNVVNEVKGYTYDFNILGGSDLISDSDFSFSIIIESTGLLPGELVLPDMNANSFVDLNNIDEAELQSVLKDIEQGIQNFQFQIFNIMSQY